MHWIRSYVRGGVLDVIMITFQVNNLFNICNRLWLILLLPCAALAVGGEEIIMAGISATMVLKIDCCTKEIFPL